MSMEECQLCGIEGTPWKKINGHVCIDCAHPEKWISAKDKLPDKDGRYLVVEDHSYKWIGVCAMRDGKFDMKIKYWMYLPEAPE